MFSTTNNRGQIINLRPLRTDGAYIDDGDWLYIEDMEYSEPLPEDCRIPHEMAEAFASECWDLNIGVLRYKTVDSVTWDEGGTGHDVQLDGASDRDTFLYEVSVGGNYQADGPNPETALHRTLKKLLTTVVDKHGFVFAVKRWSVQNLGVRGPDVYAASTHDEDYTFLPFDAIDWVATIKANG